MAPTSPVRSGFAVNGSANCADNSITSRPGGPASSRYGIFASASSGAKWRSGPTIFHQMPLNMATSNSISRARTRGKSSAFPAFATRPIAYRNLSQRILELATRREILQIGMAAASVAAANGLGPLGRAAAQQRLTESELLRFEPLGNISILHIADLHGQLMPAYLREPSISLGAGTVLGLPAGANAKDLLSHFGIPAGSGMAHSLTSEDFERLAQVYGRIGGLDRAATVIKAVRAERGAERVLLFDGGDTWQGSLTSYRTRGQDMVECLKLLKPDAMTGHWEFTHGEARLKELVKALGCPFLAQNMRDNEWQDPVFDAYSMIERGGVKIAVIGQAFPFTALGIPRKLIPNWSFGIREEDLQATVIKARQQGAALVILLSHNGFSIDYKLAGRVEGIDVILTAHTHDPLPEVVWVGNTLLVAGGSHGKFV